MDKFYNFLSHENKHELYLYGVITSEKWDDTDVDFNDFKNAIDSLERGETLDCFLNTPGGDVFCTQSIIALINRAKLTNGIKVNMWIDSLCASCGSWLISVADNIYIHNGSTLMMHLPMTYAFGANKEDLTKEIELLNKIEDQMVNDYLKIVKAGITADEIRSWLANETWLVSGEIEEYFNVKRTDRNPMVACVDVELFKNYKKVPKVLQDSLEEYNRRAKEEADHDVMELENKIKNIDMDLELLKFDLFGI